MPNQTNLVVKKNDGTTDVTFTAVTPSAGSDSPAVWRNAAIGSAVTHQPELRLVAKPGQAGKTDRLRATFVYPQIATNSTTGLTTVAERAFGSVDWTLPQGMSNIDVNEFAAQFANLLATALMKSCVQQRASAT